MEHFGGLPFPIAAAQRTDWSNGGGNYVQLPIQNRNCKADLGAVSLEPPKAVVMFNFSPQSEREVAVLAGDLVDCIAIDADRKWIYVRTLRNTVGYVPASYCRFMAVVAPQPNRTAEYHAASLDRRVIKRQHGLPPTSTVNHVADDRVLKATNWQSSPPLVDTKFHSGQTEGDVKALSPCSIASTSTSSGVSVGGTESSITDGRLDQVDDIIVGGAFNRAAVAQYGSASGSSSCSSACERRIKMLKTNEKKKLLRAKSAESVEDAANTATCTVNASGDKLVDVLWSQTLRKHVATAAATIRRPAAIRVPTSQKTTKDTKSVDGKPTQANTPNPKFDDTNDETFV